MDFRTLPGLLCLLLVPLAMADEQVASPFADTDELPTVLSATRLKQSLLEAPAAVTVIDRQMIEQSGVREIPELLRLVPGMVVGYESGSEAFVSYHGTSADLARRMQVLVDGRSIYQPLLASVDWIGLPLDLADIERIEVIRGPNAASFGVNSFFAVINIITRHPADVQGARLEVRRGEDGVEDYHARLAQRAGALDWRLSLAGRADDGFEENRRRNNVDFTDSKRVDSFYGRSAWALDDNSSVELAFGRAGMEAQQQYRPDFFLQPPVADRDNRFASLALDHDLSETHQLRIQASHSRFSRKEPWLVGLPPIVFLPALGALYEQNRACALGALEGDLATCQPADMAFLGNLGAALADPSRDYTTERVFQSAITGHENRTEIEAQDTWVVSPDLRAVYGLSYDKAVADSITYLNGRQDNTVWGLFGHVEWQLAPAWLLNVGAGQEFDKDSGDYFSPRAALNWQFVTGQVLRLVYSEAVRTPDILETSANWSMQATDLLDPDSGYSGTYFQTGHSTGAPAETITSHELGYYGRFDSINLTTDIRFFQDNMELVEHDLEVDNFRISPTTALAMRGAETALDWHPWPSQRLHFSYAYLDMRDNKGNDNTDFVPRHSGSAGWWQDYRNGWQVGTTYAFYNDLRKDQFFFDRLDVRVARKMPLSGRHQLELAAVMQWRLSDDPELRSENGSDRHRGWFSMDWRY